MKPAALWAVLWAAYAVAFALDGSRTPEEERYLAAAAQLAGGDGLDRGPQGAGLPVALAPLHALGGPTLCALALGAVAALGFVLGAALARRVVPEPWATWSALAVGLSAPVLLEATAILPALTAGTLLAGASLCALRVRERPQMRDAFGGAAMLAVLPWLDPWLLVPAAPVAVLLARWTARRGRGLVALGTLEIQLAGLVFYASLNERLYGGLTPLAAAPAPVTGADTLAEHLERIPRLLTLFGDPADGLLRWAPVIALAFLGLWLLARSRRVRLARAVSDQRDAEHAAFLALAVCAAQVLVAAFLEPAPAGRWALAAALPCSVALVAWGLRHAPRAGAVLIAATLAIAVAAAAG